MYFRTILIENTTNVKYILIKKRRKETHLLANLEKKGRRSSRLCVKLDNPMKKRKAKANSCCRFPTRGLYHE
jgi:hypothetical protein